MNIINKSKIAFVAFFAISAINSQAFAADAQQQVREREFFEDLRVAAIAAAVVITGGLVASSLNKKTTGTTWSTTDSTPSSQERSYTAFYCKGMKPEMLCVGQGCSPAENAHREKIVKDCFKHQRDQHFDDDHFGI